jgi:hypothetical protein
MSKIIILGIAASLCFSASTFAEEVKNNLQVNIASVADKGFGDKVDKINASDLKNGVFIIVNGGWSTVYSKATQLVKDRFSEKGIKVADKPEDADIGIQIMDVAFDMNQVESGQEQGVNKEYVSSVIGSAIFTGGVSLIGEVFRGGGGDTKSTSLMSMLCRKPTLSSRNKMSGDGNWGSMAKITYSTNQPGAKAASILFAAYVDHLIETNFVIDKSTIIAADADASPTKQ